MEKMFFHTVVLYTYCIECVKCSVITGGCNTTIFSGSSITHACKSCHAPWEFEERKVEILQLLFVAHIMQYINSIFRP